MEAVSLELVFVGGTVAAALHLRVAGTPVRSFGSPLPRCSAFEAPAAGMPPCNILLGAITRPDAGRQPDELRGVVAAAAVAVVGEAASSGCQPPQHQHTPDFGRMDPAAAATVHGGGKAAAQDVASAAAQQAAAPRLASAAEGDQRHLPDIKELYSGQQGPGSVGPAARPLQPLPTPVVSQTAGGPARAAGGGDPLPGGVRKLLALEVEVVQLQQSLQIAQLEFETRTVQLHCLKQRADEAEQRAQAAVERASGLARQAHAAERQASELRCQLREAAAQREQEQALAAAALAEAATRQQPGVAQASALRLQLADAQAAAERAQAAARTAAAQQEEWRERAAGLRHENQQLRVHVTAACGALKTLGIPANKVFSRAALALAGAAVAGGGVQSPPASPPGGCVACSPAAAAAPALGRPPHVPRLHLSSVSLQQLQAQQAQPAAGAAALSTAAAGLVAPCLGVPLSPTETCASSPTPAPAGLRRPPPLALPGAAGADAAPSALLTARRAVSPAQQELLAAAQQWQLSARSVHSSAAAEEDRLIAAFRPHAAAAPPSARRPPASARLQRGGGLLAPRVRHGTASVASTPRGKLQRPVYGLQPGFQEVKAAYQAVVRGEAEQARGSSRSLFSSSSAVEGDPRRVEPVVQGLLRLFQENGVRIPLAKCGPCQYRLGSAKLSVRLVNGRLVARAGGGQALDVLDWLERQPVQA